MSGVDVQFVAHGYTAEDFNALRICVCMCKHAFDRCKIMLIPMLRKIADVQTSSRSMQDLADLCSEMSWMFEPPIDLCKDLVRTDAVAILSAPLQPMKHWICDLGTMVSSIIGTDESRLAIAGRVIFEQPLQIVS